MTTSRSRSMCGLLIQRLLCLAVLANGAHAGESTAPHWAFLPLQETPPPAVQDTSWPRQPLDFYVLARLEAEGLKPSPPADRRTLIRRAYLDLIGLPPAPEQVEAFVQDRSPNAFAQVVDGLLASPRYGERWGRHWLDVARYGDSNGGDENHAYPHAYQYRNYVIEALNNDLPYDRFLVEQLAGDLLPATPDSDADAQRLRATGFLAIGTKILAEQDPVKKRADIVDEQIDTVGKVVLGLALGCARCHDHKFDPVPTRDYYALAGIFHSTEIEDQSLQTTRYRQALKAHEARVATARREKQAFDARLNAMLDLGARQEWEAESFARGNVAVNDSTYGKEIGIISDPGGQENFAEYDITVEQGGHFSLELRYAAKQARPGQILLNGKVIVQNAIAEATGGWFPDHQRWLFEGVFEMPAGTHVLRVQSKPLMSHIDKIRITPVSGDTKVGAFLKQVEEAAERARKIEAAKPSPEMAMAVKDGKAHNVKLHKRGSHADLGEEVPRGFLTRVGPGNSFTSSGSGRLELARWITRPDQPLTSRVMANRIWRWHFGKGIVATPNNFGLKGEPPTHPALLDYLARTFMAEGWSLKALHRRILLSRTWQMASTLPNPTAQEVDPGNRLYWKRDVRRMEAETFRDSLLMLAGGLEFAMGGAPPRVKSQDPSPEDIDRNRSTYEASRRRSVYLPVVRSHIYDLFTLLDFPNATTPVGNRITTTVPTQALMMLNSPFIIEQATRVTDRIVNADKTAGNQERLNRLYLELLGHPPSPEAAQTQLDFLRDADRDDWILLCQTLLISNEFVHVW